MLSNSVYPEHFPVSHDHAFDLATRELTLQRHASPSRSTVPAVKEYRYVKAKDEITPTHLPVKAQKDRYAGRGAGRSRSAPCTRSSRPTGPARSTPSR